MDRKQVGIGMFLALVLGAALGAAPVAAEGGARLAPDKARAGRAVPERAPARPDHWFRECAGLNADRGGMDAEERPFGPASPTEPAFAVEVVPCAERLLAAAGSSTSVCSSVRRGAIRSNCDRAIHEAASLALGVCSGRLDPATPVEERPSRCSAETVGDAIDEIAALIGKGSCKRAARCSRAVR